MPEGRQPGPLFGINVKVAVPAALVPRLGLASVTLHVTTLYTTGVTPGAESGNTEIPLTVTGLLLWLKPLAENVPPEVAVQLTANVAPAAPTSTATALRSG